MHVLDASAVLAFLYREPGSEDIATRLNGSLISSVNFSEVLQKASAAGFELGEVASLLRAMVDGVVPFDDAMAIDTAALWSSTSAVGLSLADRACLALTAAVGRVAVTTDTAWSTVDVANANVHVVRR